MGDGVTAAERRWVLARSDRPLFAGLLACWHAGLPLDGAPHGVGPVNAPKISTVLSDYDTQLTQLAKGSPQAILSRLQQNLSSALGG